MRWRRYWGEEPWGPWRDNMHMAILASTLLRPHLSSNSKGVEVDAFMLEPDHVRKKRNLAKTMMFMEAAARNSARAPPKKPRRVKR